MLEILCRVILTSPNPTEKGSTWVQMEIRFMPQNRNRICQTISLTAVAMTVMAVTVMAVTVIVEAATVEAVVVVVGALLNFKVMSKSRNFHRHLLLAETL